MSLEGWKTITIEECCDILDSKRVPINSEEREQRMGSIPYYGANGIQGYIDDYIFDEDLILIAEDGGYFNEFATRPIAYRVSGKSWVNNHAHVLKVKTGYSQEAVFYSLEHKDIQPFIVGGTRAKLNQSELRSITLNLPVSLQEQTQIATILSTIDRAIEQTEALIAKQQRIKTGLMQDLLTKGIDENGNIRSEETHEFKDSPLGRIPVEWDCKDIITIAYVTKLAGFEFTNYFNYSIGGEIIALRALNIKNEKLDLTDIQTIPKKVSDILPRSKINRNDILITYIGAYIGDVLRIEDNEKFHLAPNIAKIVSKDGVYPQFLEIALRTHYLQRQIKNLTATTATPSLTMTQIRSLLVAIPRNQSEQKVITEHISRITKVIDENASRLAKLKLQKTGLMQDLLTGKVRVTNLLNQKAAVN